MVDTKKYRQDLMRQIIEESDFHTLYKAGLIWFDYEMSEGNKYGLHIPKLVEIAKSILVDIKEGYINE